MTEGGIASWKKKEGESYSSGDVLLEIVSCGPALDPLLLKSLFTGNGQSYH